MYNNSNNRKILKSRRVSPFGIESLSNLQQIENSIISIAQIPIRAVAKERELNNANRLSSYSQYLFSTGILKVVAPLKSIEKQIEEFINCETICENKYFLSKNHDQLWHQQPTTFLNKNLISSLCSPIHQKINGSIKVHSVLCTEINFERIISSLAFQNNEDFDSLIIDSQSKIIAFNSEDANEEAVDLKVALINMGFSEEVATKVYSNYTKYLSPFKQTEQQAEFFKMNRDNQGSLKFSGADSHQKVALEVERITISYRNINKQTETFILYSILSWITRDYFQKEASQIQKNVNAILILSFSVSGGIIIIIGVLTARKGFLIVSSISKGLEKLTLIMSNFNVDPFSETTETTQAAHEEGLASEMIQLQKEFSNSLEMIVLFSAFRSLFTTIQSATKAYFTGDSASAIIHWANVYHFFVNVSNTRAQGISLFNVANIHLKEKRFNEAIQYYEFSISSAIEEVRKSKEQVILYNSQDTNNKLLIQTSKLIFEEIERKLLESYLTLLKRIASLFQALQNKLLAENDFRDKKEDYYDLTSDKREKMLEKIFSNCEIIERIISSQGEPDYWLLCTTFLRISDCLCSLGQVSQAQEYFFRAESALGEYKIKFKKGEYPGNKKNKVSLFFPYPFNQMKSSELELVEGGGLDQSSQSISNLSSVPSQKLNHKVKTPSLIFQNLGYKISGQKNSKNQPKIKQFQTQQEFQIRNRSQTNKVLSNRTFGDLHFKNLMRGVKKSSSKTILSQESPLLIDCGGRQYWNKKRLFQDHFLTVSPPNQQFSEAQKHRIGEQSLFDKIFNENDFNKEDKNTKQTIFQSEINQKYETLEDINQNNSNIPMINITTIQPTQMNVKSLDELQSCNDFDLIDIPEEGIGIQNIIQTQGKSHHQRQLYPIQKSINDFKQNCQPQFNNTKNNEGDHELPISPRFIEIIFDKKKYSKREQISPSTLNLKINSHKINNKQSQTSISPIKQIVVCSGKGGTIVRNNKKNLFQSDDQYLMQRNIFISSEKDKFKPRSNTESKVDQENEKYWVNRDILEQKVLLQKSKLLRLQGNNFKCVEVITDMLENFPNYFLQDRLDSLRLLKSVSKSLPGFSPAFTQIDECLGKFVSNSWRMCFLIQERFPDPFNGFPANSMSLISTVIASIQSVSLSSIKNHQISIQAVSSLGIENLVVFQKFDNQNIDLDDILKNLIDFKRQTTSDIDLCSIRPNEEKLFSQMDDLDNTFASMIRDDFGNEFEVYIRDQLVLKMKILDKLLLYRQKHLIHQSNIFSEFKSQEQYRFCQIFLSLWRSVVQISGDILDVVEKKKKIRKNTIVSIHNFNDILSVFDLVIISQRLKQELNKVEGIIKIAIIGGGGKNGQIGSKSFAAITTTLPSEDLFDSTSIQNAYEKKIEQITQFVKSQEMETFIQIFTSELSLSLDIQASNEPVKFLGDAIIIEKI